jgi:hypothetical protein
MTHPRPKISNSLISASSQVRGGNSGASAPAFYSQSRAVVTSPRPVSRARRLRS